MKPYFPRIIAGIAILLMAMLYFFPLWEITLIAPQYPSGITMYIWIDQLTGDTPGTLQNINILNHYVGMKPIDANTIPELQYFPWVVAAMLLGGIISMYFNRSKLYLFWFVALLILSILGIYDFYLWEYDYGHNLSDTAPIKVPGMSYQPPLFGEKSLLNFIAVSYPGWGGIAFGLGIALSFVAFIAKKKVDRMT